MLSTARGDVVNEEVRTFPLLHSYCLLVSLIQSAKNYVSMYLCSLRHIVRWSIRIVLNGDVGAVWRYFVRGVYEARRFQTFK
jgi:hypothetical protein